MYALKIKALLFILFLFTLWLVPLVWVNKDMRRRGVPRRAWNTWVCFLGIVGLIFYLFARGSLIDPETDNSETDNSETNKVKIKDKIKPARPAVSVPKVSPLPSKPLKSPEKLVFAASEKPTEEVRLFHRDGTPIEPSRRRGKRRREMAALDEIFIIINHALIDEATDIHLESLEGGLRIRYRVDGQLYTGAEYPQPLARAIISALKVMADIDVAERRRAQDGAFSGYRGEGPVDFRVSASHAMHGETIVVRILDRERGLLPLKGLGLSDEALAWVEGALKRSYGMVLVAGPTGSGKTTSLYALLRQLDTAQKNVITVEDPIEYELAGVTQMPVNPKAGVTFANGLRSMLRQDPDVLMVGEIRDAETAELAVQAALTGHLVFSTLHANDAIGTISRLKNMKIDSEAIASSLSAVVAQRLVRKVCPLCRRIEHGLPVPVGCDRCRGTGYRGRIGIFETLFLDDKLKHLVETGAEAIALRQAARDAGMKTMEEDGLAKARQGLTTRQEISAVI